MAVDEPPQGSIRPLPIFPEFNDSRYRLFSLPFLVAYKAIKQTLTWVGEILDTHLISFNVNSYHIMMYSELPQRIPSYC